MKISSILRSAQIKQKNQTSKYVKNGSNFALIFNKKCFLMIQENNSHWNFPGGLSLRGETPFTTLKRELQEELSLSITDTQISSTPLFTIHRSWKKEADLARLWFVYCPFPLLSYQEMKMQWIHHPKNVPEKISRTAKCFLNFLNFR